MTDTPDTPETGVIDEAAAETAHGDAGEHAVAVDEQHAGPEPGGGLRTHDPGRAATDDEQVPRGLLRQREQSGLGGGRRAGLGHAAGHGAPGWRVGPTAGAAGAAAVSGCA